jgi:phospholipid-translocating ATPase
MITGIFDQDINANLSMQVPKLYQQGIRQTLFTMERFWMYMFDAIYQSIVAYYFGQFIYSASSTSDKGYSSDKDAAGTFIAFTCVLTVNLYNGINTYYWTWITFAGIVLSNAIWTAYVVAFASSTDNRTYGQSEVLLLEPQFYLGMLLTIAVALLPRLVIKYAQQFFVPTDTDIICELQKYFWKEGEKVGPEYDGGFIDREHTSPTATSPVTVEVESEQRNFTLKRINSDHALDSQRKSVSRLSTIPVLKRAMSEASVMTPSARASVAGVAGASVVVTDEVDQLIIEQQEKDASGSGSSAGSKSPDLLSPNQSPTAQKEMNSDGFMPVLAGMRRRSSVPSPTPQNVRLLSPKSAMLPTAESYNVLSAIRKASENLKIRVPSRIRIPTSPSRQTGQTPSSSLIFMATHEELPNTGFCFSHEGGMSDLITPISQRLPRLDTGKSDSRHMSESNIKMDFFDMREKWRRSSTVSRKQGEASNDVSADKNVTRTDSRKRIMKNNERPLSAYSRLIPDQIESPSTQNTPIVTISDEDAISSDIPAEIKPEKQ